MRVIHTNSQNLHHVLSQIDYLFEFELKNYINNKLVFCKIVFKITICMQIIAVSKINTVWIQRIVIIDITNKKIVEINRSSCLSNGLITYVINEILSFLVIKMTWNTSYYFVNSHSCLWDMCIQLVKLNDKILFDYFFRKIWIYKHNLWW